MSRHSDCSINRCSIRRVAPYKLLRKWHDYRNGEHAWAEADSSLCSFIKNCSGSDGIDMRLLELTSDSPWSPRGREKSGSSSGTSHRSGIGNGGTFRDDAEGRNVAVVVEGRAESEMHRTHDPAWAMNKMWTEGAKDWTLFAGSVRGTNGVKEID